MELIRCSQRSLLSSQAAHEVDHVAAPLREEAPYKPACLLTRGARALTPRLGNELPELPSSAMVTIFAPSARPAHRSTYKKQPGSDGGAWAGGHMSPAGTTWAGRRFGSWWPRRSRELGAARRSASGSGPAPSTSKGPDPVTTKIPDP